MKRTLLAAKMPSSRAIAPTAIVAFILCGGCGALSSYDVVQVTNVEPSACDVGPGTASIANPDASPMTPGSGSDAGLNPSLHDGGLPDVDARLDSGPLSGAEDAGAAQMRGDAGGSVEPCADGLHREDSACIPNIRSCVVSNGLGQQVWHGGGWGPCAVTTCEASFHEEDGACIRNIRSCAFANGEGSQSWTGTSWGVCVLTSCQSAHHAEFGGCVPDARSCGIAYGAGIQSWTGTLWGPCELSFCDAGHHAESGGCVADTRSCSIAYGAGSQSWTSTFWGPCELSSCDAGYHAESGGCVADMRQCSFQNGQGQQRWDGTTAQWADCEVIDCDAGYHSQGNSCVSDVRICTTETGGGRQDYVGGMWSTCLLQYCILDHHLEGNACIENEKICALSNGEGISFWEETAWGPCEVQSCVGGFHIESGACISNVRACSVDNGTGQAQWLNGFWQACELAACNAGFHDEGSTCLANRRSCMGTYGRGFQDWQNTAWQPCQIDSCENSFRLEGNQCVPVDPASADYVMLSPGAFIRGSPASEPQRVATETQYAVSFDRTIAFMKTEVTQSQWFTITGQNPSHWTACGTNCPVERVDWFAAMSYANELSRRAMLEPCYELTPATCADQISDWQNGDSLCNGARFKGIECSGFRLPTDSEWEFAYRAGSQSSFGFGEITNYGCVVSALADYAWYCGNAGGKTHPVAQKSPNAWGIYDMAGNVWEWVYERETYRGHEHVVNPVGDALGANTHLRGGGYSDGPVNLRAARYLPYSKQARQVNIGFRLVRTLRE